MRAHPAPTRVGWLDGLRGVAALQVVLLHYAIAFLPGIGLGAPALVRFPWEHAFIGTPLAFLLDGSSAVYLFFIMSGVVLTYAFDAAPRDVIASILRRLTRLGVPMAAATIFAAVLFFWLPDAHVTAAGITESHWLRGIGPADLSLAEVWHQITLEGMLAGFAGVSMIPEWATAQLALAPTGHAYNPPLWSLHVELVGSLLVLLLVAIRSLADKNMYRATCVVLAICFFNSSLGLFIFGHAAADWLGRPVARWAWLPGLSCLTAGVALCVAGQLNIVTLIGAYLPAPPIGLSNGGDVMQKTFGAALVFIGVTHLPTVQLILEKPAARWLGKISFSLYLVHFPIMATVVAALFVRCNQTMPYGPSVALACLMGAAVSLIAAVLFDRWIDRSAIAFSRRLGLMFKNRAASRPLDLLTRPVPTRVSS